MKAKRTGEEMAQAYLAKIRETNQLVATESIPATIGDAVIALVNAKVPISDEALIKQLQHELARCLGSTRTPSSKAMDAQFYQFALDRLLKPAEHAAEIG